MAEKVAGKTVARDGYGSPIQYSPDGYPLPSAGQAKDDAVKARVQGEQRAIDEQNFQNAPVAGHDRRREEKEDDEHSMER